MRRRFRKLHPVKAKRAAYRPYRRRSAGPGGWGSRLLLIGVALIFAAIFGHENAELSDESASSETERLIQPSVGDEAPIYVKPTSTATVEGRASVIDGDTVDIQGRRIRLNGIDAPESDQRCSDGRGKAFMCGARSAGYLDDLLAKSRPTRCEFVEFDQYGRMVADCYRADDANVAALMVAAGWALDWPRHSNGRYAREQEQAASGRLGMWSGAFAKPWEWRAEQRGLQTTTESAPLSLFGSTTESTASCVIKGNISKKGERIYHMPGQRYYSQTKISPSKGERWFCTEAEARAAGWRRSKV